MASSRTPLKLGNLGRIVTGKTPPTKHPEYYGGNIPFVTPVDMNGRKVIGSTERTLTENGAALVRNAVLPPNSVMVSCIGSDMGKVGIAARECVTNQQINSIVVSEGYCPDYIYYSLSTRKDEFQSLASGSAQPILNKGHFSEIPLELPSIEEQRRIADVLGKLDDKIELNRRMNRTLEKMAAAIFKSWFIDFDPVHAKAEGRDPNLPAEIADLFPDGFEESELGAIPKGWKFKPIGDAVRCVGGATPSTKNPEFWQGGRHPFVTPKDMSSLQSPVILDSERHITDAGVEKISSKQLPVGTVILSSRAPIGYLGVATVPVSVNQGVIAMICDGDLPNLYVLHWTATNMDLIKSRAGGTTFAEISKRNFRPIPALVPDTRVLEAFMANVAALHQRIGLTVRQNRRLAGLRDALLPKLLSGEIKLPEVESKQKDTV